MTTREMILIILFTISLICESIAFWGLKKEIDKLDSRTRKLCEEICWLNKFKNIDRDIVRRLEENTHENNLRIISLIHGDYRFFAEMKKENEGE